jgi:hypothetical protein
MTDQSSIPLQVQALPDGDAELRLVLHLRWEDVAALGQEAGRLAVQLQRPVSLDEAASHRLRTRSAAHAKPAQDRAQSAPQSPTEHARQAIEKINGAAHASPPAPTSPPAVASTAGRTR